MGWDAFAARRGEDADLTADDLAAFAAAAADVLAATDSVDGLLKSGGLDCSACARVLEEATGLSVFDEDGWSPDTLRQAAATAMWRGDHEPWAMESAKAFLRVCAERGLGAWFSY